MRVVANLCLIVLSASPFLAAAWAEPTAEASANSAADAAETIMVQLAEARQR